MKFKKGETVIYPQHGACVVKGTKKMEFFGEKQDYLILETVINEMTLKVPVDKTDEVGEIYSVPTDYSGPEVHLNGTLAEGGQVSAVRISPDSTKTGASRRARSMRPSRRTMTMTAPASAK